MAIGVTHGIGVGVVGGANVGGVTGLAGPVVGDTANGRRGWGIGTLFSLKAEQPVRRTSPSKSALIRIRRTVDAGEKPIQSDRRWSIIVDSPNARIHRVARQPASKAVSLALYASERLSAIRRVLR
jgi:hypothetical protein